MAKCPHGVEINDHITTQYAGAYHPCQCCADISVPTGRVYCDICSARINVGIGDGRQSDIFNDKQDGPYLEGAKKVLFQSGAASSKIPRWDLIPPAALRRLAKRFELGLEKHGDRSWNARSKQDALQDREWVIARASHAIDHALKFLEKYASGKPDDGDDDASAIAWAGICLMMATEKKEEKDWTVKVLRVANTHEFVGWYFEGKDGRVVHYDADRYTNIAECTRAARLYVAELLTHGQTVDADSLTEEMIAGK